MRQTVRRAHCLVLCLLLALCAAGCTLFPESVPEFSGDTAELSVGSPYKHYFAALSVQDELRTIRIVYDPDTAHEKTAEAVLPVNTWFSVYHNGAFMETFFSDRECTQPFYDCYVREDLVIYALSE